MGRAETLQQIKEAEAKALKMRKDAEAERELMLKEGRRKNIELQESLRKEGEERYSSIINVARQDVTKEREAILEKGRHEAKRIKDDGMRNFDVAVAWLVGKFKGAVNA